MKSKPFFWVGIIISLLILGLVFAAIARADCRLPENLDQLSAEEKFNRLKEITESCRQEITQLQEQKKTLKEQIRYMDSQIQLTNLKIKQTASQIEILEAQIRELSQRINILDQSLNEASVLFINRVIATYKAGKISLLDLFFSAKNFADFFRRSRYFRAVQINDRRLLLTMEEIRLNYDAQKEKKEAKQHELESLRQQLAQQKRELAQQKKDKEYLLRVTQSNEKKYQELIVRAQAELEAIQAIFAGKGTEKKIGTVKAGDRIATIIQGRSACSNGSHLHFEVREGNIPKNPANYLTQANVIWDNDPDGPFSFGGSWRWPLDQPIRITQGYGYTFYARVMRYYGGNPHTGIDMVSNNRAVYAVQEGTLYNGSIRCGKGYLRYVRVKHKDSNLSTYYLHVNYEKL